MFFVFAFVVIGVILLRVIFLLLSHSKGLKLKPSEKLSTAIIIGSGGHTAEMLRVASRLNQDNYSPRFYILATSDVISANHVRKIEDESASKDYELLKIPRSRHVGQRYITSVFTTVNSILYCVPLMLKYHPQLILCNGPGTCVPICLIAFFMKVFFISNSTIVFVESVCRVKTLSLTGYILYSIADLFFVQWPELSKKYNRSIYVGRL